MKTLSTLTFAALLPFAALVGCTTSSSNDTTTTTATGTGTASASATGTASMSGSASMTTSAGTSGSGSGSAGTGGTGNSGTGNTGGGGGMYCIPQCTMDSDCTVMGNDIGLTCQNSICTASTGACTSDDECVATLSGWSSYPACTAQTDCDATMMVCVDVGGGDGHCVTGPDSPGGCAAPFSAVMATAIDGSSTMACGNASAACNTDSGVCFSACASDSDCTTMGYPHCNTDTRLCECSADTDCAMLGQTYSSVCNNGVCGCGADADCSGSPGGDVCTGDGVCGCSGDAACANFTNPYDGGTVSCTSL